MIENAQAIDILLVEDNPGDIRLTQEAFKEGRIKNKLSVVTDGVEAVHFLKKLGKYKDVKLPDLVLLDLNLPKKDGKEVLNEIKNDNDLKHIPVIVLTTSQAEEDIIKSYKLQANCYISKPVDFSKFIDVIKHIESFWLTVVKLPSCES